MASATAASATAAPQWRAAIDLSTVPEGGPGSAGKADGPAAPVPRKRPPKFEPHFLCDEEKGLPKLYRMASSVDVYSGRGHEVADMSRLMSLYRRWATRVYPHMQFDHVMDRIDAFGHKMAVKDTLTQLRARERERVDSLNRPAPEAGGESAEAPAAAGPDFPAGPSASDAFDAITGTAPSGGGSSRWQGASAPAAAASGGDDSFMAEVEQALADEAAAQQRAGLAGKDGSGGGGEEADVGYDEEWEALNDM